MFRLILTAVLLATPQFQWGYHEVVPYGFAPKTPLWMKRSAKAQLIKWGIKTGLRFAYDPKFHEMGQSNGILFDRRDHFDGVETALARTEFMASPKSVHVLINTYFWEFHVGDPYFGVKGHYANSSDINRVLLEEVGYAIGLHASNDPTAIMYPSLHAGPCEIQPDDIQQWKQLYTSGGDDQ